METIRKVICVPIFLFEFIGKLFLKNEVTKELLSIIIVAAIAVWGAGVYYTFSIPVPIIIFVGAFVYLLVISWISD